MKIKGINIYSVLLTSKDTYYMSDGKACDRVETIILEVKTDEGISGWGEVCPIPHYLPAYAKGVAPVIQELAPTLIGADPVGPDALLHACESNLPGHAYGKSALDIALWDLTAKAAGLPLYKLLGGRYMDAAPVYHSITCIDPEDMASIAKEVYADGIRQFQAKLGASGDWHMDVERLKAVRKAVGPGPLVYGDWNCGATKLDAIRVANAVKDIDVMIEQPCATIEACAEVRHASGLPMKLDEVCHDSNSLNRAIELNCLDVVALKLSKFGGISALRRARDICLANGVMMCMECTWGSDISTAAAAHLAVSTPSKFLLNVCDLSGYVTPRVAPDGPIRLNATLAPSEAAGLGITPDPNVLGEPIAMIH